MNKPTDFQIQPQIFYCFNCSVLKMKPKICYQDILQINDEIFYNMCSLLPEVSRNLSILLNAIDSFRIHVQESADKS